jgi:hypothetical protein
LAGPPSTPVGNAPALPNRPLPTKLMSPPPESVASGSGLMPWLPLGSAAELPCWMNTISFTFRTVGLNDFCGLTLFGWSCFRWASP